MKDLFKALVKVRDPDECARFMRDLCTISELGDMAERWQVAKLVDREIPYREINKRTGVSTATGWRYGNRATRPGKYEHACSRSTTTISGVTCMPLHSPPLPVYGLRQLVRKRPSL